MKPVPSKRLHSKKAMCIRYTLENDLYVVIISDVLDTLRPLTVFQIHPGEEACHNNNLGQMLMYGKEASNRKQEIDRQHYTIPNQRPKDKHCGKI